jgi:DNA polymerase/3'-5' exonuclease PolX
LNTEDRIRKAAEMMGFVNEHEFKFFIKKYCLLQSLEKLNEIQKLINDIEDIEMLRTIQKNVKEKINEIKKSHIK